MEIIYMKPKDDKMDSLIDLLRKSESAYYCKWCKRHLQREPDADLFIHDDVFHPDNYSPDCGGEHRLQ